MLFVQLHNTKIWLLVGILFLIKSGFCQSFSKATIIGGDSNDEIIKIQSDQHCELQLAGTFRETFHGIPSIGKSDVFLSSLKEDLIEWTMGMGSTEVDEVYDLKRTAQGELILAGSFVKDGFFQDLQLQTSLSSKASFILKMQDEEILWLKKLNGTSLEGIGELQIDEAGHIYVCGQFNSDLSFDDEQIVTEADEGLFVLKLTANGELIWMRSFGEQGLIRPKHLEFSEAKDRLFISGEFKGEMQFADDFIETNTADLDVFVASMDADGNPLWAKKAGGVLEDQNNDLLLDEQGHLFLTGNFRGRLEIDDLLLETTGTLDDNFYLLKLNENGQPLWGRSIGKREGSETGFAFLEFDENSIWMSGYCSSDFEVDDIRFDPQDDALLHPFLGSFSKEDGNFDWIIGLEDADGIIVPDVLHRTDCDQYFLGGAINGSLSLEGQSFESSEYDGFLLEILPPQPNSISNAVETLLSFSISPNPNDGWLQIKNDSNGLFSIYNVGGQLLREIPLFKGSSGISFEYDAGIYFWVFLSENGEQLRGKLLRN